MKIRIVLLTMLVLLLTTLNVCAKEDIIVISPSVKIVIDGEIGTYEDVPLIVNDRTMLPLRAVLTYLGVANDDEHIIWNSDERSVTVITDTKTIWLQVDNTIARVNGEPLQLDVAPMIFSENDRTYIPARFISESLGKKVVWDGSTTTVLITEVERHNEILAILEASKATEPSENYALDIDYDLDMTTDGVASKAEMAVTMLINQQQNAMYMNMAMHMNDEAASDTETQVPVTFSMEMYQLPDYSYMKMSLFGEMWIKSPTAEDLETTMESSDTVDVEAFTLEANDIVAAGLVIVDNPDEDVIHLKGNVYLEEMLADSLGMIGSDIDPSKIGVNQYYLDVSLERESYAFAAMDISVEMSMVDDEGQAIEIIADITVSYDVLEEGYEIVVPDKVLDAAVEF